MKYWRGYLTAAIIALFTWALMGFCASHSMLVDMVYPYVSRMIQTFLAQWSSGADFCVWQVILVVMVVGAVASAVMMIILRWNPIQWFGWILTIVSVCFLLHSGVYGMNVYAGTIADDIRLELTGYTMEELEDAAAYYRDQANALATKVNRDGSGKVAYSSFRELAEQAAAGYEVLVYEESMSIFAGSMVPVKELGWAERYTEKGILGTTVPLTGEAAVNLDAPAVSLPFVICREMARRMCISAEGDANLSAFLACRANPSQEYQYAAWFMAYHYTYNALLSMDEEDARAAAQRVNAEVSDLLRQDLASYNAFFSGSKNDKNLIDATNKTYNDARKGAYKEVSTCDLLVSWHIQEVVLPTQEEEGTSRFDPYDETKVDLSGIVNAKKNESDADDSQ